MWPCISEGAQSFGETRSLRFGRSLHNDFAGFILGLFSDPEDGDDTLLRNIGPSHTSTCHYNC